MTFAPLFCQAFAFPIDIYFFAPKEKTLKLGTEYLFKIYVVSKDVTLVDSENNWINFEKDLNEENVWVLSYKPNVQGDLNLFARIGEGIRFSGAFKYSVFKN